MSVASYQGKTNLLREIMPYKRTKSVTQWEFLMTSTHMFYIADILSQDDLESAICYWSKTNNAFDQFNAFFSKAYLR